MKRIQKRVKDLDNSGHIYEVGYSGTKYGVAGIHKDMGVQEALTVLENNGWTFVQVDFTHGTGTYNLTMKKGNLEFFIDTDQDGDFNKQEKSDVTGNVDRMYLYRQ